MARPSKLTAELADWICQSLRVGVPAIYAAEAVGIHRSTYFDWMDMGHKAQACESAECTDRHHGPADAEITYAEFSDMVMVAAAAAVQLAVGYLAKSMPRDPASAKWWLERTHPEEFKPRSEVENRGDATERGVPFTIILEPDDRPQEEVDEIMRGTAAAPPTR